MSKIADTEANATSLDGLVNDNALVPTLRNGPKPSYQYLVDGWNTEFDALIDNLEVQGDNAIALIDADAVTVDTAKNSAISSIDSDLSAFDVYYQEAKDTIGNDVAEFTIDSDAALADFEINSSNLLSEFTIDSDAVLAEFAQESAEAFNEFDLTLDQYKESRGFNTKGTFAGGFTYELPNDVGLDADGNPWILIDTSSLPVTVTAGTTPNNTSHKQVAYGTAAQVSTNTSDTVQSFIDSFSLKIFQSPTDGGLTEIQTRTVDANEVYEVRKTSDDSLATIYSDSAGTTEIVQNGTDNKSGSDGVVEFFVADGSYYVEVGGVKSNFIALSVVALTVAAPTLDGALASPLAKEGQAVSVAERTLGNGGGGIWDYVDKTTVTLNAYDAVECTGNTALALVLRESYEVDILQLGAVPDWDGVTGTDNTSVIVHAVTNYPITTIPKGYDFAVGAAGSCFWNGVTNRKITGGGTLHKIGSKGVFSFLECSDIIVDGVIFDGQIDADEAANGDLWTGDRSPTDYAFAISFSRSSRCTAINNKVSNFAWDGIVAQGQVGEGGTTATQITNIKFINNRINKVRGSMLWLKAVSDFQVTGNNGSNPVTFGQKANFIFAVEWCHSGVVANNNGFWIGDNAVGIGQMLNNVTEAVNRDIIVTNNVFKATRYHTILVAQGNNIIIDSNTITQSGKKDMPDVNSTVLTGGITVLGGTDGSADEQGNNRVTICNNIIHEAYEFGIYCFDRTLTTTKTTNQLKIHSNTITSSGKLPLAVRLDSGGIRTQMINMCEIHYNTLNFIEGDGVRVFGQASTKGNTLKLCSAVGIHYPADTIHGETVIHDVISNNRIEQCGNSGIKLFGQDYAVINDNYIKGCGINTPSAEAGDASTSHAGIGIRSVDTAVLNGNICIDNGGPGISGYLNKVINMDGNILTNNGSAFTENNYQSGVYLEGVSGGTVRANLYKLLGEAGDNQYYPIRILSNNNATAVDCRFGTHPTGILGAVAKYSINIP